MKTLQALGDHFGDRGERTGLIDLTRDEDPEFSYGDLHRRSRSLAAGLVDDGLQAGEPVALIADNCAAWVMASLAIIKAGGVCVPVDAQFSDEQMTHVLNLSRPVRAFVSQDSAAQLEELDLDQTPDFIYLDGDESDDSHWTRFTENNGEKSEENETGSRFPDRDPDDTAVIFFTSGTTGPPKGVPLTHSNLLHQIEFFDDIEIAGETDQILMPLPLHHVYPFTVGLLTPLYLGVPIVFPGALTSSALGDAMRNHDVTFILGLPRLYRTLIDGIDRKVSQLVWPVRLVMKGLQSLSTKLWQTTGVRTGRFLLYPLHRKISPSLHTLVSGGAPLDQDLAMRLEGLGWRVAAGYGLTETSPLLTILMPEDRRFDTVGQPIDEVDVRIGDKGEDDRYGEVQAKGPNVFNAYLDNEEKTKECFTDDGWFKTGDRGHLSQDGYLTLSGRLSTLIVTESGENIQPDQVEDAYEKHPVIQEIGILERDGKLVAVVVPDASEVKDHAEKKISDALKTQAEDLPSYQALSGFEISREKIPRTRLGKIRRNKLEDIYDELHAGETEEKTQPIDIADMESKDRQLLDDPQAADVWDILAERYADRRLTPDSSLALDLGIDSLSRMELALEIESVSSVELNEEDISDADTVRDLLCKIAEKSPQDTDEDHVDPLEEPETILQDEDQRWLEERPLVLKALAHLGYHLNRLFLRSFCSLTVRGEDNIPKDKPFIIISNHISYLDAPALAAALDNETLDNIRWAGWQDMMMGGPVMRFVSRCASVVPIDPRSGARQSLAYGAKSLKDGTSMIWFPEGRMSRSGDLQNFQPGTAMLAEKFRPLIVPAFIEGTRDALPAGHHIPKPAKIRIRFGEPLDPDDLIGDNETEQDKSWQTLNDNLHAKMEDLREQTVD